MKEFTLMQSITDIKKIRLFNNKDIFKSGDLSINFEKMSFLEVDGKVVVFVPDNLCLFKTEYTEIEELILDMSMSLNEKTYIRSMAEMGLIPLIGCKEPEIDTNTSNTDNPGISIILTTKCNLQCEYCIYGKNDKYHIHNDCDCDIIIKKVDEFILKNNEKNRISFIFTGGEPLLAFDKIPELVSFIEKRCFEFNINPIFALTTNGIVLNKEIMLFLKSKNFIVSLSIDGDELFYKKQGKATLFYQIDKNIKALIANGINVKLKTTIQNKISEQELFSSINYLFSLKTQEIIVTPDVLSNVPDCFFYVTNLFFSNSITKYKSVTQIILKQLQHFSYQDKVCSAGKDYVALNEKGQFIPCLFFNGTGKYFSDTYDKLLFSEKIITNELNNISLKCNKCIIKNLCGGNCYYVAYQILNNKIPVQVQESFCELKTHSFLHAIKILISSNNN